MYRLDQAWSVSSGLARALLDRGEATWLAGDYETARHYFNQSREMHLVAGDLRILALLHLLDGYTSLAQGDAQNASEAFWQGLAHFQGLGQPGGTAMALAGLGALAEQRGKLSQAVRLYAAADLPRRILMRDFILWPSGHTLYRHVLAGAHARLHSPAFANAWAEGGHLTLEQAVEYAQSP